MVRTALLLVLTIGIASCASRNHATGTKPAPAPTVALADNDVTDQFDVPEGMEVRLWARTPQLFNPTNIDVDSRGRIYVAEGVNYRETLERLFALAQRELDPAGFVQCLRLVLELILQVAQVHRMAFRGSLLRLSPRPLALIVQAAVEFVFQRGFDVGAQCARQGDFLAAGWTGN
jgi:hypothetical protein